MKWEKNELLLISAFAVLIGMIAVVSYIGGRTIQEMNNLFQRAYTDSFAEMNLIEQANTNLIAEHRALKDVALARDPEQLALAISDASRYDLLIRENFAAISRLDPDNRMKKDVVSAYEAGQPIRAKVVQLAQSGQYEASADITRLEGAAQLMIINGLMEKLVTAERSEAAAAYRRIAQLASSSWLLLIWLMPFLIILALGLSWYVFKKLRQYESRLHQEKEELQITLDSIGDGVITTDINCNVLRLNRVAEKYTGWRSSEATGLPFAQVFNIINAFSGERAKDPVEEVLCTDEICQLENHTILTAKDGSQKHIADSAAPIKDQAGITAGVVMIFRDVTERKIFQEELRQSEAHYRMLFNTMFNGYALHEMIFDDLGTPVDYQFVDLNPAFEEMTGLKKDDCSGKKVMELLPTTENYWINAYGKVVITGQPMEFENYSEALGKYFHVFAFRPQKNHFAVLVTDITQRRMMEKKIKEREERFYSLFENMASGAGIYEVRGEGGSGEDYIVRDFNQVGLKGEGKNKAEVLGKSLLELRPQIDESGLIPIFQKVWQTGQPELYAAKVFLSDESYRWYENRVFRLTSGEIVAIYDDVTEKIALNEKLQKSEEQYRLLIENQSDLIVKTDRQGCYLYVSPSYCQLFGKTEKALLGNPYLPIVHEEDIPISMQAVAAMLIPPYTCSYEERIKTIHGWRWIEWEGKGVLSDSGEISAIIDVGRDITERKKHQAEILYLNYHDVLTGLYNRKFFEEETKRLDTERQLPISVIWGDINGLKLINDGFGHSQGDRILVEIGKILTRSCRDEDIVARIGGDEFCILLPQTSYQVVQEICQRIETACERCRQEAGSEMLYPSISLGFGTKTSPSDSMDSLLKNAEAFMYRRKLLESRSMYSSIISSIKTTMVEKSHETEAHAERLVTLSSAMGQQLNLSEEQLNELALFATLHDIGKMSIDDHILNKADKLSNSEWTEMKKHPEVGYRIAMASPELIPIASYILCHHEHWDGGGYPQGLSGQKIPLLARILSIVDAYDAMTQDRPYRKAMTEAAAIAEINRHAGSQFDPDLADIFVAMMLSQATDQLIAG